MIRKIIQFCLLTLQLVHGFRSLYSNYDKAGYMIECKGGHSHAPGMHPHPCVQFNSACQSVSEPKMVILNGNEALCHPRLQEYIVWPLQYFEQVLFCQNKAIIYEYSEDTDLVLSCLFVLDSCLIAQRSGDIVKCQYCSGYKNGEGCLPSPGSTLIPYLGCGNNCASCVSNDCGTCKEGFSPSSSTDLKCSLACQPTHLSCTVVDGVYSFQGCRKGYELVDNLCVACPQKCTACVNGICTGCEFHYFLKDNQCFGDINCTKFDYNYDPNTGLAVGITCQICDFGYFYNPIQQKCTLCKEQPGLEKCLICFNATECKICLGTHIITADKKCTPFLGCSSNCQTCLYTDPEYCTTCNLKEKFQSSKIVPGKCVCDYPNNYIDKDGGCAKCTDGQCQTCGKDYYECTSCKPITNRVLFNALCICKQGYYETGLADQICLKCYADCYNCKGPYNNDCTECGDPSIYNKYFDNGSCFCLERTLLQIQPDGNSICKPCHPRCQKCSQLQDASTNQYCTMCIPGQRRALSNDYKCVCQDGYGSDGIQDICIKCHYSCMSCKGPLETDCLQCSSIAHRYLTIDNKCSCTQAYYDPGFYDQICYLSCHHSCTSCNVYGQDQCTSCPTTRNAVQVGTTFQCLCKDSHYYSDPLFLECQPCHLTCKTCNGTNQTNCLTCDTNYRQLVISKCDCYSGYYSTGSLQCSQCHYTCLSCFSSDEESCITCASDKNRVMKANKCICMNNTMQTSNTDSMCENCSYRCSSCTIKPENCTTCPDSSERDLGTDNSCQCPAFYYDQPGNPICIKCHSTCQTCQGSQSNQCTSCNLLSKRELSSNGECKCQNSYFDTGIQECQSIYQSSYLQVCSSDCLNCTITPTNCTSCKPDRYLVGNSCLCKTKLQGSYLTTYLVPLKNRCQSCHYSCLSCSGPLINQCVSCLNSESRILVATSCVCVENTFDISIPNCQKCDYRCQGCTIQPTLCKACPSLSLRVFNPSNSSCNCPSEYYDDGVNIVCQKCDYSCLTCEITSTRCDSCQVNSFRTYNALLFSCPCNDYYYDSGISICKQCHYSCSLCNAFGADSCISCQPQATSFRILNEKVCQCQPGYYDDGFSSNCQKCLYKCQNCITSQSNCTSCVQTRHLYQNQCLCDTGYYDSGQSNCSKCDSNCYNCNYNSKLCTECDSNSLKILNTNNNTCYCQPGTTEINELCQYCDVNCQTCSNSITNCTSCGILKLLINSECICINGTYLSNLDNKCYTCNSTCETCGGQATFCLSCSSDKNRILNDKNRTCICMAGYYEDVVNNSCLQCDQTCLTCFGNSSNCTECDSSLNLTINQQNRCVCKSGYFFNLIAQQCQICHFSCNECQSQTQCLTCELITRYFDSDTSKCFCKDGFFEANQKSCLQCHSSCKTCQTQSNKCLSCDSSSFRYFQMNSCPCLDGYYEVGIEMCQKCSEICKTCQISSTKCQSCYPNHLRAVNQNNCTCIPGYFDNGSEICESIYHFQLECSNSCQTCKNQKDYCTSCDLNQNRLDQSIIHKCPCISDFYQDSNEICQSIISFNLECHVKCSGCVNDRNNCLSCKYIQGSNRLTIANQCNCKIGYYDDDVHIICNKCDSRCITCENDAKNCLQCFSNLRINPPDCSCRNGYFETSQLICEGSCYYYYQACEIQCNTCQTMPSNCLTCKEGRINKSCECEEGYFEGGQPLCIQCDFQCQKCEHYPANCLACKGDRLEIPFCLCQDGYYDDFQSVDCLKCDQTCKTCTLYECLTCNGNRILSDQMTCDPPPNSVSSLLTPWCSNCEVAVMKIILSDDLTAIIVQFDFPLNPNFFSTSTQLDSNPCFNVLNYTTLSKLGINPMCIIDPDNEHQLILNLGRNPTIIPGDLIEFLPGSFGHKNCNSKLQYFELNKMQKPSNPLAPVIKYDVPTYLCNPCNENIILMEQKLYDGLRSFISVSWSFIVQGENGNGDLANFVTELTNLQLLDLAIPEKTLPIYSNVTLFVEVQNFVQKTNVFQIFIQTHAGQFPSIFSKLKLQYYPFESINLAFTLISKSCIENSKISNDNSQYQIEFYEIYRNNSISRPSNLNYTKLINSNLMEFNIQSYSLSAWTDYTFQLTISDSSIQYYSQQNVTVQIKSAGILCQFNGTKRLQNYIDVTNIYIQCKDLDVQYNWNEDPDLSIIVSCLDLTSQEKCMDSNQKNLQINSTSTSQFFPKASFQPFTIQAWTVIATKNSQSYSYKIIIVYLEQDFKILNIDYNIGYLVRPVNNYEDLQFTFNIPFQNRQYLIDYQIAIIYDYQLISILRPQYYKYSFQLYDYYQQFNKGNKFNLKFLAQYTNDIIPDQADLSLILNQPPICRFQMLEQNIKALESQKMAINCEQSDDKPYLYQMKVFLLKDDFEEFQNKQSDNSLLFNSFQKSSNLIGYFPNLEINVIFQIIDQGGSITNIQKQLNMSQNQVACANQAIDQLILKEKIAWIFEIMINRQDELNCIKMKDELLEYVELAINSQDIYEQLLAHQTIDLYKKLIMKQQASNTSTRLLEQNQQHECYNNDTFLFINTNQEHFLKSSTNISFLVTQSQKVEKQVTNLIKLKLNFEKQYEQNTLIVDTQSIMLIKSLIQMLQISVQLIDYQFVIISQNVTSAENQEQVAKISEKLIYLIDNITTHISGSVQVNGQVLLIQGMMLKLQFQKLTKSKHNIDFQMQNDYLDNLITFIQKQQLIVNYNYYNQSQTYRTMLQIYLNRSDFEIDQNHLVKTMLTNFLYTNSQINQLELSNYYRIDLAEFQFCEASNQFSVAVEYNYYCINHITENKFEKCDLEMEEIDNESTQLFCKCKTIGNLFLIKIANKTITYNNSTLVNQFQFDFLSIKLFEHAFLFVQGGVILLSFFVYCTLLYKEYKSQKKRDVVQSQSEGQDTLEVGQKVLGKKLYPGHVFIFKASFKYLHSILQFFQDEESNLKNVNKSFKFLQLSNQLSILILISIWEVLTPNFILMNALINLLILLGVRTITKIFQAIYQFGGKIAIAVVLLYFCLLGIFLLLTIFELNQIEVNKTDMNIQIALNILSTLFLVFFIFEPIAIYLRIVLYKTFFESASNNEYIPINHFIYFFIYHSRLNRIYEQLNIK